MKSIDKNRINKILIVRTDRLGDTLLNIPAIRALKQSFKASCVALVNPAVKTLLEGMPEIDQILSFDEAKWKKSIFTRLNLFWQIRRMKFDLAVILNPAKRFHILTYLAAIPWRLGYDRKWGFLLTHKIKDAKSLGQKHEVEYNLDLVRTIGAQTTDLHISIKAEREDSQFVQGLMSKLGISEHDLVIAMQTQSSNPAKCWPKEYFVCVADGLIRRFSAKIAVIGTRQERDSLIQLISLTQYPLINLAGGLNLKQLAAFFQRSKLLISNDSGPVHIAAACGLPSIVIFGRNTPGVSPRRWGPWGQGHITLHKDPGCNPCLDRSCPYGFKCLTSITPEEVLRAAEEQLKR